MADDDRELAANPGYLLGQLARVLRTAQQHEDAATRERAERAVERFVAAFQGMVSGALAVGSRAPVGGAPAWATLEVVKGGFATGGLLAGGPLRAHEEALAARLGVPATRGALNAWWLSEGGLAELAALLRSGGYRLEVPEEGALLAVAWLVERGQTDAAREVLEAIGPFLGRLRFYPVPHDRPAPEGERVFVQDVAATRAQLARIRQREEHERLRESLRCWAPLEDSMVELVLETMEGPPPALVLDEGGRPRLDARGATVVTGGWPLQRYPEGWRARATAALAEVAEVRDRHRRCRRPDRSEGSFARLRSALERAAADPASLDGLEVARVRRVLASIAARRGLPGSADHAAARAAQARQLSRPTTHEAARVVVERMSGLLADEGIDDLEPLLRPLTAAESAPLGVAAGSPLPPSLATKLARSWNGPVEELVARRVIGSSEMLARVLPQLSAQVVAAGIPDPALRGLLRALYAAFRRRRSLLLLNLQHQVRIGELPWVAAIERHRAAGLDERGLARRTLERVVTLAVTGFPHVILPNKLLQELRALAERAGLALPLVDEVAADIFMGTFTEKYLRAAQHAARLLEGRLYATYYGIDCAELRALDDVKASRHGAPTSEGFARLCARRAAPAERVERRASVAANGVIIEQEQILTTHNLAVLLDGLGLLEPLASRLEPLARAVLEWIAREQRKRIPQWKPRLRSVKSRAYAWRQMVFLLSFVTPAELDAFLAWAPGRLAEHGPAVAAALAPALRGLALAAAGQSPEASGAAVASGRARVLLGWTLGKHWLLEGVT